MLNKRLMSLLLVVALLAVGSVFAQEGEAVTLEIWSGSSSPVENEALEAQIAAFEEANPDIDVELLISPDYGAQIQTALASDEYPDVFMVGQFEFPNFVDSGVLMPAEDRIEEPDDIYPGLLSAFTDAEGTVYCPPKDFSTLALFYNKDMFDEAGVEYPTAEWTWEDMHAAAEALTTDEVAGFSAAADHNRWLAFFDANGGQFVDEEGAVVFNSEAAAEALNFYASFTADEIGATPGDLGAGWNGEAFGRGLAAMTVEGNWAIGYLQTDFPELNWGVVEIPTAPNGEKGTLTFTVCWAVGANTEHPDEAWQLVNFLTGTEGAMTVAEAGFGVMPARMSASEAWLTSRGEEFAPFVTGGEYAWAPVFPVGFNDFVEALTQGTVDVMAGDEDAQDVLDEAAEIAQEIYDEMGEDE